MKNNIIFILFLVLLVIPITSSQSEPKIPTAKQHDCVTLIATCANCTFVNITTIRYPLNGTLINLNTNMTGFSSSYNYNFCNTTVLGEYTYNVRGNPDGAIDSEDGNFLVTKTGDFLDISQAIFMLIFISFLILILIFLISRLVAAEFLGSKVSYFLISYMILLIVTFSVYRLVSDYLATLSYLGSLIFYFFLTLMVLLLPIILICIGWLITDYIRNIQKKELMKRGHSEDEATRRMRKR